MKRSNPSEAPAEDSPKDPSVASPPMKKSRPKLSLDVPLYRAEGLFALMKPLEWTSNDAVSYVRGILERDTRERGGLVTKVGSRKNKSRTVKVGHGGTLDPLASGVLVIGVGKGTKELQKYLKGSKKYVARGELGYETTTLDVEGEVTKRSPCDHVTKQSIKEVLPQFQGEISQIPPIFSAIRKNGKRLHEEARKGKTAKDLQVEPRQVHVYDLNFIETPNLDMPHFDLEVECGGGTYIRSLIRDIGYKVDSVATTTVLTRTKQGQFTIEDCLLRDDWNADNIYAAIERFNSSREKTSQDEAGKS